MTKNRNYHKICLLLSCCVITVFRMNTSIFNVIRCHFSVVVDNCARTILVFLNAIYIGWAWEWWCWNSKVARVAVSSVIIGIKASVHVWLILQKERQKLKLNLPKIDILINETYFIWWENTGRLVELVVWSIRSRRISIIWIISVAGLILGIFPCIQ